MGTSFPTRVEVVSFTHPPYGRWPQLAYVTITNGAGTVDEEPQTSDVLKKAAKALRGAQPGDIVEVVWDYDIERPVYPIVEARRITGTLEARVEALEALVAHLQRAVMG